MAALTSCFSPGKGNPRARLSTGSSVVCKSRKLQFVWDIWAMYAQLAIALFRHISFVSANTMTEKKNLAESNTDLAFLAPACLTRNGCDLDTVVTHVCMLLNALET